MDKRLYGKYKPDGSVDYEPSHCILSEKPLLENQHATRGRVANTPFFYRILSKYAHRVTDNLHNRWAANVPKQGSKVQKKDDNS